MNNKEIDKQIALKIMGWRRATNHWVKDNKLKYAFDSWYPSTNIANAWQVVEKMTTEKVWFRITSVHGYGYEVTIFKAGLGKRTKHSLKDELVTEFENTAPLAISKAALKAVEKK